MKITKRKKILKSLTIVTIALSLATLTGCGNRNVFDEYGDSVNTFRYVTIEENGQSVLHRIKTWADSESESATFRTECCNNYIWTSANNSVFYQNKPEEYAYSRECCAER